MGLEAGDELPHAVVQLLDVVAEAPAPGTPPVVPVGEERRVHVEVRHEEVPGDVRLLGTCERGVSNVDGGRV